MSWATEEWKDGLSVFVLKNISELEQHNERTVKDNKQKLFQLENCIASLEKQKRLTEEEKGKYASLKTENQILSESCGEAEKNKQKLLNELHLKDDKLSCVADN
jgi:oligoribonuclease NrnB/cAMP/cGMP phosphodiesterase (DHH superfamily)